MSRSSIYRLFPHVLAAFLLLPSLALGAPPQRGSAPSASLPDRRWTGGQLVRWRGLTSSARLIRRRAPLERPGSKAAQRSLDASFAGDHPMFRRLSSSGWYRSSDKIERLQQLANGLRRTRRLSSATPLHEVELLSFDLESTGSATGKLSKGDRTFRNGWDEATQFGWAIIRNGVKVGSGKINIRPDVSIVPGAEELTGLNSEVLANAPRFEQVAHQILELMQGRVLIGQSAIRNDWSWLQSNFARLGVDLPRPKRLILDTYLLSFNTPRAGRGVKDLAEYFGVPQEHAHDARDDAEVTAQIAVKMLQCGKVCTLGDAFRLQHEGYQKMRQPRAEPAVTVAGH